jgi:hypothetical protein
MHVKFMHEILNEGNNIKNKKQGVRMWNGPNWLRSETGGRIM